jgi:hypothetical protein
MQPRAAAGADEEQVMTTTHINEARQMFCGEVGNAATYGGVNWLGFAASPTFAIMALCTGFSHSLSDMLCISSHGDSPMNEMAAMYALMSLFHVEPWLSLLKCLIQRGSARH